MLAISAKQMAIFDQDMAANYVGRLVAEAEQILARRDGKAPGPAPDGTRAEPRQVVMAILAKAEELGIRSEADVTPFFRMTLCDAPEFRQTGLYPMAVEIVTAKQYAARERMDALYSLLPDALRASIFSAEG